MHFLEDFEDLFWASVTFGIKIDPGNVVILEGYHENCPTTIRVYEKNHIDAKQTVYKFDEESESWKKE